MTHSSAMPPAMDPALAHLVAPHADVYRADGRWDESVLCRRVGQCAEKHPSKAAVVDDFGSRRMTYCELEIESNKVAQLLVQRGVSPGDVVAVQLPNWAETVVLAVAISKVRAVINPMLPVYRSKEIEHMMRLTGARVFFSPGTYRGFDHGAMAAEINERLTQDIDHIVVEPKSWLSSIEDTNHRVETGNMDATAVSEIIFTSGTEAMPKAIMHTEETANSSVRSVWRSLELVDDDVVWMPSPVGHSTGFNFGMRIALYYGLTLVLQDRWDPPAAARLVATEKPTYTVAATTFLTDLLDAGRELGVDLSSLRVFGCGGAPVPPSVVHQAESQGVQVLRLYGQTEVLLATWNRPNSSLEKRRTTDGCAVDDVEIEIRNDHGDKLAAGEEGEIFFRGPSSCVGFFEDPERTRAKFAGDGWVRTGDLGVLDADGYLTIVGRKSEIIIRGGMNITPREIEDAVATMPMVQSVAVVGLPDDRLGEITCACVVLREGTSLRLDDLVEHLRSLGMATYKLPQRLEVVSELPMTSTGKVQRSLLTQSLVSP